MAAISVKQSKFHMNFTVIVFSRLSIVTLATLALLNSAASAQPAAPAADKQPPAFKIEDLSWLSGQWKSAGEQVQNEEHWTDVAGGTLLGMSRTVRGETTAFFEYLRIEARAGQIYYIALPGGKAPGTVFRLVKLEGQEATFENPMHDFPKRIIYLLADDGTLTARIEGDGTEKEKPQEFKFRRQESGDRKQGRQ